MCWCQKIITVLAFYLYVPAWCYVNVVLAMGLCLSVIVCVCTSLCHTPVLCQNGCMDLPGIWPSSCPWLMLYCVGRKFGYLRNNGTCLLIFSQTLNFENYAMDHRSSEVQSTVGRCLSLEFITLTFYLCIQCETATAGLSLIAKCCQQLQIDNCTRHLALYTKC